jgi:hypothetical protein
VQRQAEIFIFINQVLLHPFIKESSVPASAKPLLAGQMASISSGNYRHRFVKASTDQSSTILMVNTPRRAFFGFAYGLFFGKHFDDRLYSWVACDVEASGPDASWWQSSSLRAHICKLCEIRGETDPQRVHTRHVPNDRLIDETLYVLAHV